MNKNMARTAVSSGDFERIAAAIDWIDAHIEAQPETPEIAAAAGLSAAHFSRLFRRWAGISPGRYLKHRTLQQASDALDRGASVLDAALTSGLSGPSRLHDLFVSMEAMTPGEYKTNAKGLLLAYDFAASPFGRVLIVCSERGIVELQFIDQAVDDAVLDDVRRRWSAARFSHTRGIADRVAEALVTGSGSLQLAPRGTNFQLKVWHALLAIPDGATARYADIAAAIGQPSAARAVGNAIGANPIAWLIPCHRVLRANGALGGYRWGPRRKATVLAWEQCQALANSDRGACNPLATSR
ncbi:MAG: bifunctional helix-turn-helix domain-containing protein/methylated-DNA--[protein]-cysteine S-methyltransferase [Pseudomonadota bacterium]